ncbi:hypothetical protein AAHE18_03G131900 [Arachis hypogaea]
MYRIQLDSRSHASRERECKKRFGDGHARGAVQKARDSVTFEIIKHDFLEERGLPVTAGAAVGGVFVVVEGVIGGLDEVAAAEDEVEEVRVERVKEILPVVASQELVPCGGCCGICHW